MHTSFRSFRTTLSLGSLLVLVVACAGESSGSRWTYAPVPTGSPAPSGSPGESPGGSPGTSPGSPGTSPGGSPGASPGESPSGPSGSPTGEVIELTETDTLQITQDDTPVSTLTVQQGQTYTFRIVNPADRVAHNFYIGPSDRLEANEVADLPGVPEFEEGAQEFQYEVTEETASLEFACTIPGHYTSMHGTFTVEP